MNLLLLHNRYLHRGGEDVVFDTEQALLRSRGHRVTEYVLDNHSIKDAPSWRVGLRAIWSRSTYREVRALVRRARPDVAHVHNFFPLISPAAHHALKAQGVPVVQTLHNYRLICPNGLLFRDGHACEDCVGRIVPWPAALHACYRRNRAASGAVAAMLVAHRFLETWRQHVDIYIAPTEFARAKFIQSGFPPERILVKPHVVYPDPGMGPERRSWALFVGRGSAEKGLDTLLAAWAHLGSRVPLKVIADAPPSEDTAVTRRNAGIEWLQRLPLDEVHGLMGEAMALVFPSKTYETFGRVVIEAFAKGTPVIASDRGAAAEIIEHGRTGLLFRTGDPEDLAARVEWVRAHPADARRMGRAARAEFEAKYTVERNYELLMAIYARAINAHALSVGMP